MIADPLPNSDATVEPGLERGAFSALSDDYRELDELAQFQLPIRSSLALLLQTAWVIHNF
jgi:hypothetical protein